VKERSFVGGLRHRSPLRYPGGKARLTSYIQQLFRVNRLEDGEYAEPYAGGAGVALGLLFTEYVSRVHINDLDRSIYAFWHSVLNETDALCSRIASVALTVDEWRRQRGVQENKGRADLVDLGFSTFFLNRVNRSGIIASGGLIGGLTQRGVWKMDARFNRDDLIRRIQRVASYRDRIRLYNLDAIDFLAVAANTLDHKSLVYLDPPYFIKGERNLYSNSYKAADHAEVSEILDACPWPWVVSYDATPEILRLYSRWRRLRYGIDYTAAARYRGAEVMFFSPELTLPYGASPVMKHSA
jgi:DNA adenine methylase